jgi:hypothetical protein
VIGGATAASIDVHFRYALTPMECGTFANRGDVLESSVAQVRLLVPPTSSFSVNVRFARSGRS